MAAAHLDKLIASEREAKRAQSNRATRAYAKNGWNVPDDDNVCDAHDYGNFQAKMIRRWQASNTSDPEKERGNAAERSEDLARVAAADAAVRSANRKATADHAAWRASRRAYEASLRADNVDA